MESLEKPADLDIGNRLENLCNQFFIISDSNHIFGKAI